MKKIFGFLVAFCLLTAVPAAAQFDFGVKAGVNLSQKPTDLETLKKGAKGNTGWFVGPTAKFVFPIIGLGVEANILYSQSNVEIEDQSIMNQSIEIPLYLRYEINLPVISKFVEPFVAVGPQFGWNIGHKNITLENIGEIARSYNINDSNISLNIGIGIVLFDHVQIHGNYNLALGKTAEYATVEDGLKSAFKSKTNIWQVSLAYLF